MAGSIKGIVVEIGGDTSGLQKALSKVNSESLSLSKELKGVNSLLKFDPKNTELLSQKQSLLKDNIKKTSEYLDGLKKTQAEYIAQGKNVNTENYRNLTREIASTEIKLKDLNEQQKNSKKITLENAQGYTTLKNVMANLATDGIKAVLSGFQKLGQTAINVGKEAVSSFADYQQLTGGVEKIFGDSADKVKEYANQAYETTGLSANQYMENVTSFSASLIKSVGGDSAKATEIANQALIDMADNANTYGTDMSSIQNAFQGFAKQNYTMLDNLKLRLSVVLKLKWKNCLKMLEN